MKRVCGWCATELGEIKDTEGDKDQVTTGICPECADFFTNNTSKRPLSEFLNSLPYPVAVMNGDARIEFANEKACKMLGKSIDEFKGWLGGDAFQCAYARLPGGCGKTEHCKACTIRMNVTKTYLTGESQKDIVASLMTEKSDKEIEERYVISTQRKDDLVFLKINKYLLKE